MNDTKGIPVPVLKKEERDPLRALKALARGWAAMTASAALVTLGLSPKPGPELAKPRSTIRPMIREGSKRLDFASQAARGALSWGETTVSTMPATTDRWLAIARSHSAIAQLRAADDVSQAARRAENPEDAADKAEGAFAQQLRLDARRDDARGLASLSEMPAQVSDFPAPDVTAANATPYQGLLEMAYNDAREAGALGREAPRSLALGAALVSAGRAMLEVPGAALAARALIVAGAAATKRGLKQAARAKALLERARGFVSDINMVHGQKAQGSLASACVEALAQGADLERCRSVDPAITVLAQRSVDRELSDHAVWEVEGGRRL